MRISRWCRWLGPVATAGALAAASLLAAAPAHALDTAFTTSNRSGAALTLIATPKGNFSVRPASVADLASNTWNVIFYFGQDNWADVHYAIGTTGYQLWLSANPAYNAYPPELRCTVRNASKVIVSSTPQGTVCRISGTQVVLATPVPMTTTNRTFMPLTVDSWSGTFPAPPDTVSPETANRWSALPVGTGTVTYRVGTSGYRARVTLSLSGNVLQASCAMLDATGTTVFSNPLKIACTTAGTAITVGVPRMEVADHTGVALAPERGARVGGWVGVGPDTPDLLDGQSRAFYPDLLDRDPTYPNFFGLHLRLGGDPMRYAFTGYLTYSDTDGKTQCQVSQRGNNYQTVFECQPTGEGWRVVAKQPLARIRVENLVSYPFRYVQEQSYDWVRIPDLPAAPSGGNGSETLTAVPGYQGSALYETPTTGWRVRVSWTSAQVPAITCAVLPTASGAASPLACGVLDGVVYVKYAP